MITYPEYKYGEKVLIDIEYSNSSTVTVVSQTGPNRMFTKVKNETTGYEWETMTNRLTRIPKNDKPEQKS
jgi:hypothetical protein